MAAAPFEALPKGVELPYQKLLEELWYGNVEPAEYDTKACSEYKEALRSNNSAVFQMAQTIKKQWLIHCDAARVPEYVSQNEMNDLLEI